MMRRNSLAFRLISSAAVWSVIVLLFTGITLSSLFRSAVERNFDARLQAYLDGLIANIELNESGALTEAGSVGDARFDLPLSGWYWQVGARGADPSTMLTSRSLLDQTLALDKSATDNATAWQLKRFYLKGPEDQSLRVIKQDIQLAGSTKPYSFTVAGNSDELETEISTFNNTLIIALSIMGLGVVLAALIQVRFGLQPLRIFQQSLSNIRTGHQTRLSGTFPDEVQPLAEELNALLEANEAVVKRARTHVGNLAHALKTPLSVIINEAQSSQHPLAGKIEEQADMMRDQVNLYLDRARMAARGRALGVITEVRPVVDGLVRTLTRLNRDSTLEVDVACDGEKKFRGEKQDLEETIGNLLENAFKWAKSVIRISVTLDTDVAEAAAGDPATGRSWLRFVVEDDGPGLKDHQKADALKRGRRLDETTPGSGLGLSIVVELVTLYGGKIELHDSELGGLRVELLLPGA